MIDGEEEEESRKPGATVASFDPEYAAWPVPRACGTDGAGDCTPAACSFACTLTSARTPALTLPCTCTLQLFRVDLEPSVGQRLRWSFMQVARRAGKAEGGGRRVLADLKVERAVNEGGVEVEGKPAGGAKGAGRGQG